MNLSFQTPAAFLLLIPVALFGLWAFFLRENGAFTFSSSRIAGSVHRRTLRGRLAWLPLALRIAALLLLVVALSRPRLGRDPIRNITDGVAMVMAVDASGSMNAAMRYRGKASSRFEVAKSVFKEFLMGNGRDLGGRPNDLVGVVAFAGEAETISPLTHSHDALVELLDGMDVGSVGGSGGTAIGEAIALSAARLKTAEEQLSGERARPPGFKISSKLIILLTDGRNNTGKRTPEEATALSRDWGIKIYSIAIGGEEAAGEFLQSISDATGGVYRPAEDEQSLRAFYEEIDRLEKTSVESVEYLSYREYFFPLALCALALLILEQVLGATLLRRLP